MMTESNANSECSGYNTPNVKYGIHKNKKIIYTVYRLGLGLSTLYSTQTSPVAIACLLPVPASLAKPSIDKSCHTVLVKIAQVRVLSA